jgi:hypothetical protein
MDRASKAIGVKNINQPSIAETLPAGSTVALPFFVNFVLVC